jgi:hypothetical protein
MTDFYELDTKKARIAHIREQLGTSAAWALRGLVRIYANQTADEQAVGTTKHHNDIGFTGADAEILTSFAQQYERRGSLSPKQMGLLFKKMPKYAKQLESVSR